MKNQISKSKKPLQTVLSLGPENVLKQEKKSAEKIYFSDIRQNNKSGIFTNIISKTPEEKPTIQEYFQNKYIYIEFNDMIESFLNGLVERFDEEYLAKVQDDYHLSEIIENYKSRGFLKCKIDLYYSSNRKGGNQKN